MTWRLPDVRCLVAAAGSHGLEVSAGSGVCLYLSTLVAVRALRDTVLEMASMNTCSTKWPPVLVNEDNYESWKNDLLIWCDISELDKTKQAQTVHLSMPLESRARAATSEVPRSDLKKENGVEIILK